MMMLRDDEMWINEKLFERWGVKEKRNELLP